MKLLTLLGDLAEIRELRDRAPVIGWALHRQNQRHSWDDSHDRPTRGMQ